MRDRGRRTGRCAGRIAGLAALLWLPPGAAAPASETGATPKEVETPRTARFGGVSIGMTVAEMSWKLESQGFRRSEKKLRRYVDDGGDVKKRIRYRELPGPDGAPTIYELDYTEWYAPGALDGDRFQAEVRKRLGEPYQVRTPNVGRTEMIYVEVPGAPTVVDVANACQAEIQKKNPALDAAEAEKQAGAAVQYDPANDRIEKACPGAVPMYRKLVEFLEGARLTIVIRGSRVDTMVRWPYLEAELIRQLGRHEAALVTAGSASPAATSGGP